MIEFAIGATDGVVEGCGNVGLRNDGANVAIFGTVDAADSVDLRLEPTKNDPFNDDLYLRGRLHGDSLLELRLYGGGRFDFRGVPVKLWSLTKYAPNA